MKAAVIGLALVFQAAEPQVPFKGYTMPATRGEYQRLTNFAYCLAVHESGNAAQYLDHYPFEKNYDKIVGKYVDWRCLNYGQLKAGAGQLQGAVANALLRMKAHPWRHQYTMVQRSDLGEYVETDRPEEKGRYIKLYEGATCSVHNDAQAANELLRSSPQTIKSSLMVTRMEAVWRRCTNSDFSENEFALRGLLAEAIYRSENVDKRQKESTGA